MTQNNNMPLTWPVVPGTTLGTIDFDLGKAASGWPLVTNQNPPKAVTDFFKREGQWYAVIDGTEYVISETGSVVLLSGVSLKLAVAEQDNQLNPETELENTPDNLKEISSLGPLEQFAMGALQGILGAMGTDPLDLTEYQIVQASDKAFTIANAMMKAASKSKKAHNLRSATYPKVHNTVGASKTDQLLSDIAKQLVELNKNLSVDILKVTDIDDDKLALGIGNGDGTWTEPNPNLNENDDDIKQSPTPNPNLYSIAELLFLQRRELKDLAKYNRIKETDATTGDVTITPIVDIVKKIQDALYQKKTVDGVTTVTTYADMIDKRLDDLLKLLKVTSTDSTTGATSSESIAEILKKTLTDIGEALGVETGDDQVTLTQSLANIKTALDGVKASLTATTIIGEKSAANVLTDHTDKLEGIRAKIETISGYLINGTESIAALAATRNTKLGDISTSVSGQQTTLGTISSRTADILSTVGDISTTSTGISGKLDTSNSNTSDIKNNTSVTAARVDTSNTKLDTINTTIINK